MRVIGGTLRRRKLHPLRGLTIRPTSDYLRESIFNILAGRVDGAVVLDLFAGSGSLGIEALSRGAASAVFVDSQVQSLRSLAKNISTFGLEEKGTVLRQDILRGLGFLRVLDRAFDLVFMDPPYNKGFAERSMHLLDRSGCVAPGACLVIEHSTREPLPDKVAPFQRIDQREKGKTAVSFYEYVL
ncbi:MAG: 16S rRNA (guanine(966)-N(2))-methyltransferase RsmD [Thermodesulfobacteriota bacterium]|nr:16S rRNA (guanine(966)-N(2))-methyltransferase RsmD [Thermodesulfobacteriota bacterium]